MAETEFCVPSLAVRLTGVAFVPLGVVSATFSTLIPVALGLCPRDVTGIQPRRVRAVNESNHGREPSVPKDLGTLDSCDKHRNEGVRGVASVGDHRA